MGTFLHVLNYKGSLHNKFNKKTTMSEITLLIKHSTDTAAICNQSLQKMGPSGQLFQGLDEFPVLRVGL